jgi:hypothetical protein
MRRVGNLTEGKSCPVRCARSPYADCDSHPVLEIESSNILSRTKRPTSLSTVEAISEMFQTRYMRPYISSDSSL